MIPILREVAAEKETFRFFRHFFDIDLIRRHVAAGDVKYEVIEFPVAQWAQQMLGLNKSKPDEGGHGLVRVDLDHVKKISEARMREPVFLVEVPQLGNIVVDGSHRVAKAYLSGQDTVPAYHFPASEFKKLQGPVKQPRRKAKE